MSTVSVTNIKNAASASNNLVLDSSGNTTAAGTVAMGSSYLRNRIINGDMRIDQRNAGAAVTINGSFPVDRFVLGYDTGSQSSQRSTVAPTGFTNSLALTISTGASPTAAQQNNLRQFIEGFNVADFGFGSAAASSVTLSFWVRSSVTGTYSCAFMNSAYNRSYVGTYTINSANTWEQKSITIAGDTTGTWLTDNGVGLRVFFDTGSGSNYNTTAGAWVAGEYRRTSGSVSLCATTGATFYITGVQLEVGTVATPFERRMYGTELMLCQRYFWSSYNTGVAVGTAAAQTGPFLNIGTNGSANTPFITTILPVSMRASPTITTYSPTTGASGKIRLSSGSDINGTSYRTTSNAFLSGPAGTGGTTNEYEWHVTASIEL